MSKYYCSTFAVSESVRLENSRINMKAAERWDLRGLVAALNVVKTDAAVVYLRACLLSSKQHHDHVTHMELWKLHKKTTKLRKFKWFLPSTEEKKASK
jgi:hypothetical protein